MTCPSCRQELPSTARFCSSCGTPCAGPAAAAPALTPAAPPAEDERKPVTVLFCDLVGSTALSGVLDPETLRTVTLRYFEAMSAQIVARGGTPEKFIGDAVMAVFGVPVVREDDARRALAAALGMRRALDALNEELYASLGIRLTTRIGVNTGQVVAGSDTTARQALVSGEVVNIAARLEQNAGPGEILIGPQTLLAAGPTVTAEPTGPLQLKGKRDSVEAYRLLALGADDPELLRRFDAPFVGRTTELDALGRSLDEAVREGRPGLLRVTGEAGIGKTRLVREWLTRRSAAGAFAYGAGRCRTYGDHGTLAPLADAVRSLLPHAHAHGDASAPGDEATDDAMALLSGGLLRDGTPNAPFEDMCAALTVVLKRTVRDRPVVLVFDDWHAAAPLLVRTVDRLTGDAGPARVLVICAGRPEEAQATRAAGEKQGHLQLTGLPREEAARLAAGLARLDGRPAPADDRLLARAEGNPLYLEQLLVDDGTAAASGPEGELPPTLQALLGARIGALARTERGVVDLAAVIGREFAAAELVRLELSVRTAEQPGTVTTGYGNGASSTSVTGQGPEDRRRVDEALAALALRRLVEPAPPGAGEPSAYRFSSGLVHEVAYASLSKRAKAERHAWAAELPSVLRTGDGAVGGHLERAYRYRTELGLLDDRARLLRDRAAAALGRAGAQAAARSDLHWAHGLLERAVELRPDAAGALLGLGEVRVALGRVAEGAELLRTVRDLTTAPVESAHARLALAVLDPAARPGPAATARAVLPVFEAAGDAVGRARAHLRLAQQLQQSGRHEEAERDHARALEHAVEAGAEPERAGALGAIGISLWRGPVPVPDAVERCRALLAAHGSGRPTVRVTLNCPLAVLYGLQDRADDAYACLAEAERLAGKLGFAEAKVFLPVFRATVEALLGRGAEALALLARADAAARRMGAAGMRTAVALDAARLELDAGDEDRAARWLAGVGDASELSRADAVDLEGLRARLAARARPDEAFHHADRAVRASLLTDSPLVQAAAELDRARTLAALDRTAAAEAAARSAGAHFAGKGHLPGTRRVAAFLAAHPGPAAMATTSTTREGS
ncbi:adenylate/guanylate cyclase domain-containing protein [Streptomyces cyaneofuscatus]|uniref:adenylate/guanylate cyclase domain-containing protein n=1 Tax=Streptomyces TaxID=1883 RepID=UPI000978D5A8|nr:MULTISPECIES: adenylate/guanylate cyclase domain-containing protein [unclassified Streptomyces]ONI54137.1 Adenylate cyclase 2 [Streptomyces sp. IB2014 011-1]RDV52338.1 adenylate/guanylate cyclase domain-containing protein [Streptomyces sp. IB2014 011-12]